MNICCVCGTRPNFVKVAAVIGAMEPHPELVPFIVHTGQHYDERVFRVVFDDLGLPRPHANLEVGSASHAVQTAEVMTRFEAVLEEQCFDLVIVVGDVNSTVACALVAAKLGLPVAHVEAGLRSFDRSMPEELNRAVTDALSDLLFVSEPSGLTNLRCEGAPDQNVFFVGNVMIDTLLAHKERAEQSRILEQLGVEPKRYGVLTLHRPSNVDNQDAASRILEALDHLQGQLPVVFPAHPRTAKQFGIHGLMSRIEAMTNVRWLEPLGYLDFLKVMSDARLVLTDSGGIQEETTILEVPCITLRENTERPATPCITLRENTERPATVEAGLNQLAGSDPDRIKRACERVLGGDMPEVQRPEKWDGHAGERIVEVLLNHLDGSLPRR
ncbi:MAG: non-hydrolyzing UDP-N-acetylglucosamine 2-epimerase [Planctomycetota bacterium]